MKKLEDMVFKNDGKNYVVIPFDEYESLIETRRVTKTIYQKHVCVDNVIGFQCRLTKYNDNVILNERELSAKEFGEIQNESKKYLKYAGYRKKNLYLRPDIEEKVKLGRVLDILNPDNKNSVVEKRKAFKKLLKELKEKNISYR